MGKFLNQWTQTFPPAVKFTEKQCPDLTGKVRSLSDLIQSKTDCPQVFITTRGITGIGYGLSKIHYQKNGTVFITGRSRCRKYAMDAITEAK
jgi:short-subunit dehydrogenase involved in D-alanine esterification of teichoic acids